ncbi:hypothetical protein F66182_5062, partial [Fusarium sp. NRRL 66182]
MIGLAPFLVTNGIEDADRDPISVI